MKKLFFSVMFFLFVGTSFADLAQEESYQEKKRAVQDQIKSEKIKEEAIKINNHLLNLKQNALVIADGNQCLAFINGKIYLDRITINQYCKMSNSDDVYRFADNYNYELEKKSEKYLIIKYLDSRGRRREFHINGTRVVQYLEDTTQDWQDGGKYKKEIWSRPCLTPDKSQNDCTVYRFNLNNL